MPEDFFAAYITAALWSTTDQSDESGGVPLDRDHGPEDIDAETLKGMRADCEKFWGQAEALIAGDDPSCRCSPEEYAGHDFWLTRNGHGSPLSISSP